MLSLPDYLDAVPKVELHLHIAGAVRATTLAEIAACWSSIPSNRAPRQDRIRRMFEAGLNIVLGTDDPTMFGTSMNHFWRALFAANGWDRAEARRLSLAGVDASWLPEARKAALRTEFSATLATLDSAA